MRIAYLPDGSTVNTMYRSVAPMLALAERGHETRRLDPSMRSEWAATLRWCDVLHVHRVCDPGAVQLAQAARAAGAAVVWDDDDDVTRVPKGAGDRRSPSGAAAVRRRAARTSLFQAVDLVTTPSAHLADVFREGGAPATHVIENFVIDRSLPMRRPADQLRIGWIAGAEHRLDLERIPIAAALTALLEAHPELHVTAIGLDPGLAGERYTHVPPAPLPQALELVSSFSVGIAPLSPDWAVSRARSSIKVKEYSAMGVPWLASPIGPYAGLGEKQGGRLVEDDRWYEELDSLIRSPRGRRRLAKRADRWGRDQLLSRNAHHWERAFEHALERRGGAVPQLAG